MTAVLTAPPDVEQLTAGGQFPHLDCGEACVVSNVAAAGLTVAVRDVETWDLHHDDNPDDGTMTTTVALVIRSYNVGAALTIPCVVDQLVQALERGHRCIALVGCDGFGHLPGPEGHFVTVWGFDGTTWYVENPLGGSQRIADATFRTAFRGQAVEVLVPAASPTPTTGGDPLTPDERKDLARALVRVAFHADLHRNISEPDLENWAGQLVQHGFDAGVDLMTRAPEFGAVEAEDFQRDHPNG